MSPDPDAGGEQLCGRTAYPVEPQRQPDARRCQQSTGAREPGGDVDLLVGGRDVLRQVVERVGQLAGALGPGVRRTGGVGDGLQRVLVDRLLGAAPRPPVPKPPVVLTWEPVQALPAGLSVPNPIV